MDDVKSEKTQNTKEMRSEKSEKASGNQKTVIQKGKKLIYLDKLYKEILKVKVQNIALQGLLLHYHPHGFCQIPWHHNQ